MSWDAVLTAEQRYPSFFLSLSKFLSLQLSFFSNIVKFECTLVGVSKEYE